MNQKDKVKRLKQLPRRSSVTVSEKGGGLYILLPAEIAEFLGVGARDKIAFLMDFDSRTVLMIDHKKLKAEAEGIGPIEIGFSLPKKSVKKLLAKNG